MSTSRQIGEIFKRKAKEEKRIERICQFLIGFYAVLVAIALVALLLFTH